VVIRSRIPMDILLRAYVGELIRSVVKQMTLRKEKGTPIILWNEIINVLASGACNWDDHIRTSARPEAMDRLRE